MGRMIGAIYAVPKGIIDRLFDGKNKVFVKVTGHASTKIQSKHKIIFYASHNKKELVGEGIVEKSEFLIPSDVVSKYRNELFLSENEFRAYVGKRTRVLALRLRDLKRYKQPIKSKEVITMAGKYISVEDYEAIVKGE